jgi:hypothetical protein
MDKDDLAKLQAGLSRLQHQLPSHQVATLKRGGLFIQTAMVRRARAFELNRGLVNSIGISPVKVIHGPGRSVVVGPGAAGGPPLPYAERMEKGWGKGRFPNIARIRRWAGQRLGGITDREIFNIGRAMMRAGGLSSNNPRARDRGYHYVRDTMNHEGKEALRQMQAAGFEAVDKLFASIKT